MQIPPYLTEHCQFADCFIAAKMWFSLLVVALNLLLVHGKRGLLTFNILAVKIVNHSTPLPQL